WRNCTKVKGQRAKVKVAMRVAVAPCALSPAGCDSLRCLHAEESPGQLFNDSSHLFRKHFLSLADVAAANLKGLKLLLTGTDRDGHGLAGYLFEKHRVEPLVWRNI